MHDWILTRRRIFFFLTSVFKRVYCIWLHGNISGLLSASSPRSKKTRRQIPGRAKFYARAGWKTCEVGAGKTENTFIIILEVMGVRVSVSTGQGKKYILENLKVRVWGVTTRYGEPRRGSVRPCLPGSYHTPFSDRHLSPSLKSQLQRSGSEVDTGLSCSSQSFAPVLGNEIQRQPVRSVPGTEVIWPKLYCDLTNHTFREAAELVCRGEKSPASWREKRQDAETGRAFYFIPDSFRVWVQVPSGPRVHAVCPCP